MALLPKISNCPIRENETGICMCNNRKCDGGVSSEECSAIRSSYAYGYSIAESKYLNELKDICSMIVNRMNELEKEQE